MRLAPVPIFYANEPQKAVEKSGQSSLTTHATKECIDACRYFGGLIVGALQGRSKDELLAAAYNPTGKWRSDDLEPEIYDVANGSFRSGSPRGTGYVVDSLSAALWCFLNSDTFESGCLLAANLGQDADTTAAVYGQIAGAYYGVEGIPARWLDRLAQRELIEDFAVRLAVTGS